MVFSVEIWCVFGGKWKNKWLSLEFTFIAVCSLLWCAQAQHSHNKTSPAIKWKINIGIIMEILLLGPKTVSYSRPNTTTTISISDAILWPCFKLSLLFPGIQEDLSMRRHVWQPRDLCWILVHRLAHQVCRLHRCKEEGFALWTPTGEIGERGGVEFDEHFTW